MMRRIHRGLGWGIVLATMLVASARGDQPVTAENNRELLKAHAGGMLRMEKFDELEAAAEALRSQKLRFPDGSWKLYWFYEGMNQPRDARDTEAWTNHFEHLEHWRAAYSNSVTAAVATGHTYVRYAWRARGGGFAREVTEEGWRLFRERMQQARGVFEQADKLTTKDPELYRGLLVVATAQAWDRDKVDEVFDTEVKLEPGYYPVYFAKANYLLPRWHGVDGDVERFAAQSAAATKEREGDTLYARIAWSVSWAAKDDFFEKYTFNWQRMKRGFLDMEKDYPHSEWNLNHYCLFACLAKDKQTARSLFDRIGEKWEVQAWKTEGRFQAWRNWARNTGEPPVEGKTTNPPMTWRELLRRIMSW